MWRVPPNPFTPPREAGPGPLAAVWLTRSESPTPQMWPSHCHDYLFGSLLVSVPQGLSDMRMRT